MPHPSSNPSRKSRFLLVSLLLLLSLCALGSGLWFYHSCPKPQHVHHDGHSSQNTDEQRNADVLLQWKTPAGPRLPTSSWVFSASDYQTLPVSREPSAAVALPQHRGFLVLDDEPDDAPSGGILFYRFQQGHLRSIPVKLPTLNVRWDDWEGATASKDMVFLITSHSRASHARCQLCRFPRKDVVLTQQSLQLPTTMECRGGRTQRNEFIRVLKEAAHNHGFALPPDFENRSAKHGGLDIEGMAWDRQRKSLLIGLRGPLAAFGHHRYAILLEAHWKQQKFSVSFRSLLELQGRGVRAMTTLPSGKILLSAGPLGNRGSFDLVTFVPQKGVKQPVRRLTSSSFPALQPRRPFKPEALVWFANKLFILSDNGSWGGRDAHFLVLPKRKEP